MFINKSYTYALVGATDHPEKYGNIIFRDFAHHGYHIIPVNPNDNDGIIEGQSVYKSLKEIPEQIDVVIFVTPPQVTLEIIPLVKELGINKVWIQPGAEHPDAVKFCEEHSIECQYNACIMVARRTTEATMK